MSSSISPIKMSDARLIQTANFYDSAKLSEFLSLCLTANLAYQSERTFLSEKYRGLGMKALEAFELFWDERGQDSDNLPVTFDTIIVAYDPEFRHYFDQLRSLFYTHATGKQAPSSNATAKLTSSETSTGDVQKLPDDQIFAFIKAIPTLLNFIAEDSNIATKKRRFGFTYVKKGFKIKFFAAHHSEYFDDDSDDSAVHVSGTTTD